MATILVKLLQQDFSPSDIIKWLKNDIQYAELPEDLKELNNLRSEFVPFFINYLRDQSFNLLQSGHSSNTTPAKTPLSTKFKKQLSKNKKENNRSRTDIKAKNRIQLFDSSSDNVSHSAPRKLHGTRCSVIGENTPRSQRSIHFNTPDNSQRSKSRHSFGDFFTPEVEKKKKSPHSGKKDDYSTPVQQYSGKRSTGKKSTEKHSGFNISQIGGVTPQFTLEAEDFPSLADGSTSTPKPLNKSIPDGARMITPSRRITPTLIKSSNKSKKNTLKEGSGNKRQESPGAGSKPSIFASPSAGSGWNTSNVISGQAFTFDKTPNANSSLEDERQLLRAMKCGKVDSPSDTLQSPSENTTPMSHTTQHFQLASSPLIHSPVNIRLPGIVPISNTNVRSVSSLLQSPVRSSLTQSPVKSCFKNECTAAPTKASVLLAEASGLSRTTPVKASRTTPAECSTVTPTKPNSGVDRELSVSEYTPADPSLVAHKQQLSTLCQLYTAFIHENLVPNLTVELYFLIQLLTVRGGELEQSTDFAQEPDEVEYLSSVHNAVFFAVTVLSKQTRILKLLDKGTLRLLLDNQRITEFDFTLKDMLSQLYDTCPAKLPSIGMTSPIGGVSFQAETDNRNNFPTDRSFHLFRKQRDMFYELLRIWQENHMTAGWCLRETQGSRIHSLVAEKSELANFVHFTRLFQSQLIHMCKADKSHQTEGEDNNVTLLVQLKKTNPEKFKRLQERFITPASSRGPCPKPAFPGCQEFFRDFVLSAECPQFYQHLSDTLTAKIMELNNMEFHLTENLEDTSDVEERERLSNCLITTRLLAKFLGLLHFLPYQSTEHLPARITNTYIGIRDKVSPAVDLLLHLKSANQNGRLVLTVPWIIEYLSMMDVVAPLLQYFQGVLTYLLNIHRYICIHFGSVWSHSLLLVVSCLGWLFELAVFPEGLFFKDLNDGDDIKAPPEGSLDTLGLVDQQIVYTCCPYLSELRVLLVEFAVGTSNRNNQSSIRKITPISTDTGVMTALSEKQLQHQLEENFFHNHPASLKRTVEFVADRVASNHIKKFRANVLPHVLQKVYKNAGDLAVEMSAASPDTRHQKKNENIILQRSLQLCSEVRKSNQQEALSYCENKVIEILPQLLPEEISSGVVQVCGRIAQRLALEKIHEWMSMHITTAMLKREMTNEYDKRIRSLLRIKSLEEEMSQSNIQASILPKPVADSGVGEIMKVNQHTHDFTVYSPSELLIEFKKVVCDIIVKQDVVNNIPLVLEVMDKVPKLFKYRQDTLSSVTRSIGRILSDVTCFLVCSESVLWQSKVKDLMLPLLEDYFREQPLFDGIISHRILLYILRARDKTLSWKTYGDLLNILLKKKFVSPDKLSTSAVTCIQSKLDPSITENLTILLCDVIKTYHLNCMYTSEDFFSLIDTMLQAAVDGSETEKLIKEIMSSIHNHHTDLEDRENKTEHLNNENKVVYEESTANTNTCVLIDKTNDQKITCKQNSCDIASDGNLSNVKEKYLIKELNLSDSNENDSLTNQILEVKCSEQCSKTKSDENSSVKK